jgi:transglutaminase-like putative cysteine protease
MRVRVGCHFELESDGAVPLVVLVRPRADGEHRILHELRTISPDVPVHEYFDAFGNVCWRLVLPGGPLTVRYDALVEVSGQPEVLPIDRPLVPVEQLPDNTLVFTLPSRYVQSDLVMQAAWDLFGSLPWTSARVQAICDWVHTNIRYVAGTSDLTTTALDTFQRGYGVCRDIALLSVAFCRALNIPARYGFGYLGDIGVPPMDTPMDFHAWFNAFIDGRWHIYDARFNEPRIGRIEIGHGRDPVDVAMTTSYGPSRLNQFIVWSDEVPEDRAADFLWTAPADKLLAS